MNINSFLTFTQVMNLIVAVGKRRTVIVEGPNGIGKTAVFYALSRLPQFQHYKHALVDCTQLSDGSVWMPDLDRENGVSRELPNERFGVSLKNQKGINGAAPVAIGLDEIAKCPQYIKNVLAPIVYERRVGNIPLPDDSLVCGFTNMAVEGLGDSIQPHLRSRLIFVKMRGPTVKEWVNWGIDSGKIIPEVLAAAEAYPKLFESFIDYEPGGVHAGKDMSKENLYVFNPRIAQQAYVNPRSLHAASDVIQDCTIAGVDDQTLLSGLSGTIGEAAAQDLQAYIKFGRDLPLYESVVNDPDKVKVPESAVAQSVQVFQFVTRVNSREEGAAVIKYVNRIKGEMQAMFCHGVVSSSKAGMFATVPGFAEILRKHKVLFTTA
jgi:hypothetical protein